MAALRDYCRERLLSIPGMVPVAAGTAPHILAMSLAGYPSDMARMWGAVPAATGTMPGMLSSLSRQ